MIRRLLLRPDYLFLVLALAFGLVLVFLIPPFAGNDEKNHYQRVASIAYLHFFNDSVWVPAGIAEFIRVGGSFFLRFLLHLYPTYTLEQYQALLVLPDFTGPGTPLAAYGMEQYQTLAAIPLHADATAVLTPNYITVLHPLGYLPQALAFRLGAAFGLSPLGLLYLARAAGLLTGVKLTFMAIRRMPSHRYVFAALALLPTAGFLRSSLTADTVTNGVAFLFIALVLRECARQGVLRGRHLAQMAVLAFVLVQCKSGYLPLLLLPLLLPAKRFSSPTQRLGAMALLILPGVVGSVAWALAMKYSYFAGLSYRIDGIISPDQQTALMLAHPLEFAQVLLRTFFSSGFLLEALVAPVGDLGWQIHLWMGTYPLIVFTLFVVLAYDASGAKVTYTPRARWLAAGIVALSLVLIETLLYIQWTRVAGGIVIGFNGRYLLPLLPLLLLFAKNPKAAGEPFKPGLAVAAFACIGGLSVIATLVEIYFR